MYEDPPRRKPPSIGELLMRLTMQQDATRVAPRYAPAPYEEKIRASEVPQLGGIPLAAARRALRPSTRFSESPAVQFGSALMKLTGLSDPLSAIEGPARAMGIVGKVGKAAGKVQEPGKAVAAAIRLPDGRVFTGPFHGPALTKAREAMGFATDDAFDDAVEWASGFVDANDNWLGRKAAQAEAGSFDQSAESVLHGFQGGSAIRTTDGQVFTAPSHEAARKKAAEAGASTFGLENGSAFVNGSGDLVFQSRFGQPDITVPRANRPTASPLSGTRVLDEAGQPKRVFHGTSSAFNDYDPTKLDKKALFGPGFYHTEDAKIAGGKDADLDFGYSSKGSGVEPNVRPARLNVQKPFDIDDIVDEDEAERIVATAEGLFPDADWDYARDRLYGLSQQDNITGEAVYRIMSQRTGATREQVNAALKTAGYDGITHMGGTGKDTAPHKVWIAFDREQIRSPWGPAESAPQWGRAHPAVPAALLGGGIGAALMAQTYQKREQR